MKSFLHVAPAMRVHHGPESLEQLPRELDRLNCRRALIVCGRTLARPGQGVEFVRETLAGRCAGVYAGVLAHSPLPAVEGCVAALRAAEADAVVVVGGGSAIVTARAASILLAEGREIGALCTTRAADGSFQSPTLRAPKLPQLVVLTTPTTACAKAGSAVQDPVRGRRLALFDPKTRAVALFIHPALALGAPAHLARDASLNTLAMAVEGLESATGDPLADGMLMHALRLLGDSLPRLTAVPRDAEVRAELMLAAFLCGRGTDVSGGGIASALGHALGARYEVANGLINAIVLPVTMRFNRELTGRRLGRAAEALTGSRPAPAVACEAAILAVDALLATLGVPRRLRDVGVPREALPGLAEGTLDDWFAHRNPRPIDSAATVEALLETAW